MRERIEQVGDILLAAAHADHHVEAAEIDKIEAILKSIWRQEPSPDSLVRRVTEFREGDAVDAGEMARLGSMLRDLQPRGEELPASLVQRLADFDASRFDIDEAVGPFLHEDPNDRPPAVFGGVNTLHFDRERAPYVLLPVIEPARV